MATSGIALLTALVLIGSQPAAPTGSWERAAGNDQITLRIDEKGVRWTFVMPGKGTTTMHAPDYKLSEDGVIFGIVRTVDWKNGPAESHLKDQLLPFAISYRVDGDSLHIRDVRLFGADRRAHEALLGTYRALGQE